MPGFFVALTWNNPRNASDIKVCIKAVRRELLLVLTDNLQAAATKHRKRVLKGNLPDLNLVVKRLKEEDRLTVTAILCHS
jgi:hypothetical protein